MKKQGFTLIELMVVIVIMGILAAVAVPKLFGMIAKSKASEVGPAAGTYVKFQDAHVSEKGTVADGATNYTGGVWTAHNIATLNDCQVGDNWKITTAANNSTGGTVLYDATVTANCEPLTANFTKLKTTAATTGQGENP